MFDLFFFWFADFNKFLKSLKSHGMVGVSEKASFRVLENWQNRNW